MRKAKELNSIAASNPLFGAASLGETATAEIHPAQDRLTPALHLRNTDLPDGYVRAKKPRERKTTRPR